MSDTKIGKNVKIEKAIVPSNIKIPDRTIIRSPDDEIVHVTEDIYDRVRGQFSEKELSDLTFSVMAINAWNRVNVAF